MRGTKQLIHLESIVVTLIDRLWSINILQEILVGITLRAPVRRILFEFLSMIKRAGLFLSTTLMLFSHDHIFEYFCKGRHLIIAPFYIRRYTWIIGNSSHNRVSLVVEHLSQNAFDNLSLLSADCRFLLFILLAQVSRILRDFILLIYKIGQPSHLSLSLGKGRS